MKNIHILPTDKPTGIFKSGNNLLFSIMNKVRINNEGFHIYITNDEEIKEGDWIFNEISKEVYKITNVGELVAYENKIILSTDPYLITDGVQAIDDEFLEWFVKNPTCEEVETKLIEQIPNGITFGMFGNDEPPTELIYKIIIPQEETKQYPIGGYAPGFYGCTCVTCKIEFMGHKRAVQCEPCAIKMTQEEPKQETLEEAVRIHLDKNKYSSPLIYAKIGAKYQAERMYSEEDMLEFGKYLLELSNSAMSRKSNMAMLDLETGTKLTKDLFEQFKKK
jgi:hypothetical protein